MLSAVAKIVAVYTAPKSKKPLSGPANSPDKYEMDLKTLCMP